MKNNRFCFSFFYYIVIILCLLLWNCDTEKSPTYTVEKGETTDDFEFTDASSYSFGFSGSPYFEMKDGYCQATVSSGKWDNTIKNWVLTYNLSQLSVTGGFEAEVYCGENMNFAGIEWLDKKEYCFDMYDFEVFSDGRFYINLYQYINGESVWTDILNLSAEDSYIVTNDFNRIRVCSFDNGKTNVYLNNNLVYTFETKEMKISPAKIAISFQAKKKISFSSENSAVAKFRILSLENVK